MDNKLKDLESKPSYPGSYIDLLMRVAAAAHTFVETREKYSAMGKARASQEKMEQGIIVLHSYKLLRVHTEALGLYPDLDKVNRCLEKGMESIATGYLDKLGEVL